MAKYFAGAERNDEVENGLKTLELKESDWRRRHSGMDFADVLAPVLHHIVIFIIYRPGAGGIRRNIS